MLGHLQWERKRRKFVFEQKQVAYCNAGHDDRFCPMLQNVRELAYVVALLCPSST